MPGALSKYYNYAGTGFLKLFNGFSILAFILLSVNNFSLAVTQQNDEEIVTPSDSIKNQQDSIIYHVPLSRHGSYNLISTSKTNVINKSDILWDNYSGLSEIINHHTLSYPFNLGGFYNFNQYSAFGGSSRDNNFRFNNRPLNDIPFGTFNTDMYPVEFFENIEVLTGSDAVLYSGNSSGSCINIQEILYNSSTPYTKLWINEYGTTFIASDGVFSQNILPNTNMTFGFRKVSSKGEFDNQSADGWNLRGLLRFNLSDYTNISISENFYNHFVEMNGGVDEKNSTNPFSPVDAYVKLPSFSDRTIKHDITSTLTSYLTSDTSSAVTVSLFSSIANYTRELESSMMALTGDSSGYLAFPSNSYGGNARYEKKLLNVASLSTGGEIYYTRQKSNIFNDDMTGLHYSAFGRLNLDFSRNLSVSGGIRLNSQLGRFYNSFGGKILYKLSGNEKTQSDIFGDLSISQRVPTASEGLGLKNENHFLTIGGFHFDDGETAINSAVWFRSINNPILNRAITDSTGSIISTESFQSYSIQSTGINLAFKANIINHISLRLSTDFSIGNKFNNGFSDFKSNSELDGYYIITAGASELRLGIELSAIISNYTEIFYPQKRVYAYLAQTNNLFWNGLNVYARARLGNTYFKLNLQNLLGAGYYYIAGYPGTGRYISFSVNWPFLD